MNLILATQGSQGVVALRELIGSGVRLSSIVVAVCDVPGNPPLFEFLKYLRLPFQLISTSTEFDDWFSKVVRAQNIDLLVSIGWRYRFSGNVVYEMKGRSINLHPGLLPDYKGSFSTAWSIINGEQYVGYTYHEIDKDFDNGGIYLMEMIEITNRDTAHSLNFKIMQKALAKLGNVLELVGKGTKAQPDRGQYYPNLLPFGGQVQESWGVEIRARFIRAIYFPPLEPAFEVINGKKVFLYPPEA